MNKDNNRTDEKSLEKLNSINKQLLKVREKVFCENKKENLGHSIDFDLLPVSMLHTCDIERFIFADYDGGEVVRGFDVTTGSCFYEDLWDYNHYGIFHGFSNCSSFIMTTTPNSKNLRVFDLVNQRSLSTDASHRGHINDMVIAHKENYTITASQDGDVNVLSNFNFEFQRVLKSGNHGIPTSIALIPFQSIIVVGYLDGSISLFNINTGRLILNFVGSNHGYINSLTTSENHIIAAIHCGISVFDMKGNLINRIPLTFEPTTIRCGIGDLWQHSPKRITSDLRNDPFMVNTVFVPSRMGKLLLYDFLSGELIHTIEGHNEPITSLIISSDKTIFTGSVDGAIRQYDYKSKKCIQIFYKNDGCRSVSFSKNSKLMGMSGVIDNKAKIVDMTNGKIIYEMKHQDSIRCVRFKEIDGIEYLFTGSWDRTANQYNVISGELVRTFIAPGRICDLLITSQLIFIAFYDRDKNGGFQINDVKTGKLILLSNNHEQKHRFARCVILGKIDNYFFTGGDDGKIYQWNIPTASLMNILDCKDSVRNIYLDSSRNLLYAGLDDSVIEVWDFNNGILLKTIQTNHSPVIILALTEEFLYSGHESGVINQYDLRTYQVLNSYTYHSKRVWDMYFNKSNRTLITSSADGTIKFISVETGKIKGTYYNLDRGFLWVTEPDENHHCGYYWTDRTDRLSVTDFEKLDDDSSVPGKKIEEYHSIYNNKKIVMSKICGEGFFELFNETITQLKKKNEITKLAENTQCKLLKEGSPGERK